MPHGLLLHHGLLHQGADVTPPEAGRPRDRVVRPPPYLPTTVAQQSTRLKPLAIGVNPVGIVAIGVNARGVVALGVNAVGLVAIGLNAMAGVVAVGLNALGPVAISAVNSVGLLALAIVNSIGAWGFGAVNSMVHPVLAFVLGTAMAVIGRWLGGRWEREAPPRLVPLLELQRGTHPRGWVRAQLLEVDRDRIVVGDRDGQHALVAEGSVLGHARDLLGASQRRIYAELTIEQEPETQPSPGYRAARSWFTVLRALELRPVARRVRWPAVPTELDWLLARSLMLAAGAGFVGALVVLAVQLAA